MVESISVQEAAEMTPQVQPSFWSEYGWYIAAIVGVLVLGALVAYGVYRILKGLLGREDVIEGKKKQLLRIARGLSRRSYASHFFKWNQNAPIRLWWIDAEGRKMTRTWGYYMGDMTHEAGFQIIAFSNKSLHWLLWFVPKIEPIYIATKSSVEYLKSYDAKMHRGEVGKIDNIPCEKVSFADGEIWIHAVSLCEEKGFFKPVLLDKDGHTIDQSIAMHSQINEVVAREYTYNITNSFVDNAKRGYEMNADVQQTKKLNDSGVVNTTR